MCNISLNIVTEHEYLGICLHHKLSWCLHIDRVRNKANRLLNFLKLNLYNASTQIKEYIYTVALLLSYLGPVPSYSNLEMIQHYAADFVLNKPWHRQQQNDSIKDMLTWPSLED